MGDHRSKSFAEGRKQVQTYYAQRSMSNLRGMRSCCSFDATYAPPLPTQTFDSTYAPPTQVGTGVTDNKLKKSKSTSGSSWRFSDPEVQRKKRVASYKVYSVEEKVKGSFRKSFKWIKDRYNHVVYGWRWKFLFLDLIVSCFCCLVTVWWGYCHGVNIIRTHDVGFQENKVKLFSCRFCYW